MYIMSYTVSVHTFILPCLFLTYNACVSQSTFRLYFYLPFFPSTLKGGLKDFAVLHKSHFALEIAPIKHLAR